MFEGVCVDAVRLHVNKYEGDRGGERVCVCVVSTYAGVCACVSESAYVSECACVYMYKCVSECRMRVFEGVCVNARVCICVYK